MLFADLFFIYFFLPVFFAAYYFSKTIKAKNIILVIASLVFYAWGGPVNLLLLVFSSFVNFYMAKGIAASKKRGGTGKIFLVTALLFDIGILGVFKYTDFVLTNINGLLGTSIPLSGIVMPLGISFFTFQIISYVVDVYWDNVKVQTQFYKLLMYISMFPQLVAGPIVRYETIEQEINDRSVSLMDICDGAMRIIIGLAKKVLIANSISLVADGLLKGGNVSVVAAWVGAICYALQIYFDFSGYSDMAIGMGRCMGFHFDENFDYPFVCRSISEFWQRWHISLGSFFRDYLLYIPLFGKRRPYLSIFLVWFTTGLWHGASWNFIIWGLYFGVFVFAESKIGKKKLKAIPTVVMHVYNKIVIIIGFGIFYFTNMNELGGFFKSLVGLGGQGFISETASELIVSNSYLIIAAIILSMPVLKMLKNFTSRLQPNLRAAAQVAATLACATLLFISTAVLVDTFATNNPFVYWNF